MCISTKFPRDSDLTGREPATVEDSRVRCLQGLPQGDGDSDARASLRPASISQPWILGGKKFEKVLSFLVDGLIFMSRGLQEMLWNPGWFWCCPGALESAACGFPAWLQVGQSVQFQHLGSNGKERQRVTIFSSLRT